MVFITEGFFEVAIESWPEWDLNPQPLNSVQTLYLHCAFTHVCYIFILRNILHAMVTINTR